MKSSIFYWGEIFGVQRVKEFYLFESFTKVLEREKNLRVEGEEIFNSREYKRDVMVFARRIRLIQRNLCSINLYDGLSKVVLFFLLENH